MTRKKKIVLLSLVLAAALTLTAITATMDVTDTGGDGSVNISHSPLVINDVRTPANDPGNLSTTVGTTVRGFDRITVNVDSDLVAGDDIRLIPNMDNTADRGLFVRLVTNTSENVNLTQVNPNGVSDLVQVSSIDGESAVYEFRLNEGATGQEVVIDYNVTDDAAGTRGQFDIGLRLDPLSDDSR